MKRNKALYAILMVCLMMPYGCIKDNLTKPADLNLVVTIPDNPAAGSSVFKFSSGYMAVESVSFEGIREGGTTISFESDFDDLILLDLFSLYVLPEFRFNIPQGSFTFMKFFIETGVLDFESIGFKDIESLDEYSLVIFGDYTDSLGNITPVIFLLDDEEIFSASIRSQDPGTTIILEKGIQRTARLVIDPYYAFAAIPLQSINQADRINIDGVETILISKEFNSIIYSIAYLRISNSCSLSIQ